MREVNIGCQQQRSRSHALQRYRAGFLMADFRPLLDHIFVAVGSKTKRDFERIRRVVQMRRALIRCPRLVGPCQAIIKQRSGSVAVGVNHLQGRFPDVTVARLRIKLIVA